MNDREAIRFLADMAAGLDPDYPEEFPDRYKKVRRGIEDALFVSGRTPEEVVRRACDGVEKGAALAMAIIRALPADAVQYQCLEELAQTLPPVEWLWKGWIPEGFLSLLGASPGAGKSYLALDLARRLTAGDKWPDGVRVEEERHRVIYVDAESKPTMHAGRAEAWGMDRGSVYMMLAGDVYGSVDLGCEADQERLVNMTLSLDPGLVIIDSFGDATNRGENAKEEVLPVLRFLASLAGEFKCGVLLVHHLRKRSGGDIVGRLTVDHFRGSGAITAKAVSVLGLSLIQTGPEFDRNGPRLFEVVKANLCAHPAAIGVTMEAMEACPDYAWVRYGEEPKPFKEPTEAEECAEWLVEALAGHGEPMRPAEAIKLAEDAGFKVGVVYRARRQLAERVADTDGRHSPNNRWVLADGE